MKRLAGSSISDDLIKYLWLQRLPQQTQAILYLFTEFFRVKHHIITSVSPVSAKVRRLAPDKPKLAKKEFEFMLEPQGFTDLVIARYT
ncbi:hypothetical protein TNCV_2470801 [Trichonephila clavipes]|nr:hypothetical protein TNCV_2470801 [Trichonephila clavipes]